MSHYGPSHATRYTSVFLGLSLSLLVVTVGAQEKLPEPKPEAGDLLLQGLNNIRTFNTDRFAYAKKQELAKFIPAGQEVRLHLFYRFYTPARGEKLEIKVLDDIHPFPIKYLAENDIEYREEETTIKGTGIYVKRGAPVFPSPSSNPQVGWIEWNQWRESSQKWAATQRAEVSMRPATEPAMREDPNAPPQLDPGWLEQNRKLLNLSAKQLRQQPDAALGSAAEVLRELNARATGPLWSPTPGGILLSPAAAGKLGDGLTIDKVEYIPGSDEVKITGRTSAMGLDADLLATTLRLAFGYNQIPYFSLDGHEAHDNDWYDSRHRIAREVSERLRRDSALARRVRQNAFEVVDKAGRRHLVAYLDQVDPALAASASKRMPMNMDLVFEPKWLNHTRLGEMLFIADNSLKELWYGAAVWTHGPSRALTIGTHIAPMFWNEKIGPKKDLEELLFMRRVTSIPTTPTTATRWWFTPGGQVRQGEHVLDLSQIQPVLQTEPVGGIFGDDFTFHPEIPGPWEKAVVEEVNQHFESYARAFPEWEGLRQVFRAYVFAMWLVKNDPDMGSRLLEKLPLPRPPSKPLPSLWPDPQILIVSLGPDPSSVEIEQATIAGGVGFERNMVKMVPGFKGGESRGIVSTFPSSIGFTPKLIDDDVSATSEGYEVWRQHLLKERGYLWGWIRARLVPAEVTTFVGIALVLALFSLWVSWKMKMPFSSFEAGAMAVDWLATTLSIILIALHPDIYKDHTAAFTGWWHPLITYASMYVLLIGTVYYKHGLLGPDRIIRFLIMLVVMLVVLIWTAFTPGLGEIVRGLTPLHLAAPLLGGTEGALPADIVYSLEALKEGLILCRSAEPRYALYLLLVLLVLIGVWFESKLPWTQSKHSVSA